MIKTTIKLVIALLFITTPAYAVDHFWIQNAAQNGGIDLTQTYIDHFGGDPVNVFAGTINGDYDGLTTDGATVNCQLTGTSGTFDHVQFIGAPGNDMLPPFTQSFLSGTGYCVNGPRVVRWDTSVPLPVISATDPFGGGSAPTINSYTLTPDIIDEGQSSTLAWDVSGADTISIDQGVGSVSANGNSVVSPTVSTTYTLTATNTVGSTVQAVTLTVNPVNAPGITLFTADPPTLAEAGNVDLTWSTSDADTVSIDNGVCSDCLTTGTTTVNLSATTTFTITASNSAGSSQDTLTVTVGDGTCEITAELSYETVFDTHYAVWQTNGLFSTINSLSNITFSGAAPIIDFNSMFGTVSLDFTDYTDELAVIKLIVIAGSGFLAFRIIFGW